MARHIREHLMYVGAKIQNGLEKSANNSKEYRQKAATSAYVLVSRAY